MQINTPSVIAGDDSGDSSATARLKSCDAALLYSSLIPLDYVMFKIFSVYKYFCVK